MQQILKLTAVSRSTRHFLILATIFLAYCFQATPLVFAQNGEGKGIFEKITKKPEISSEIATAIVVTEETENSTDNADDVAIVRIPALGSAYSKPPISNTKPATGNTFSNDVTPLPTVEDQSEGDPGAEIEDDGAEIEEVEVPDPADTQPALPSDQSSAKWPGWLTDYRAACQQGKNERKMVVVYFYDTNVNSPYKTFETGALADEEVQKALEDFICVRIPITTMLRPTKEQGIIQIPGSSDQFEDAPATRDEDVTVLSQNVTQGDGKAVITQTVVRNSPPSSGTQYTAMRPPSDTIDVSKLLPPGRDMGSVAQMKAPAYDLTFDNLEQETMLIRHPAFYEMLLTPGIAIIDYKHEDAEYYGKIVSVFPFLKKKPYTVKQTLVMLNLPPGTVTQRSLIFAVRIHPESPKSTDGVLSLRLTEEARSASQYQADILRQGHHNWDRRFQRINLYLPTELWACEVCAESWPGQHLLESAIECVDCWRFSEGHWSAVSAEHPYYGYDMKLGTNGIWYGTGVFGKWRHPTLAKAGILTGGGELQTLPKR